MKVWDLEIIGALKVGGNGTRAQQEKKKNRGNGKEANRLQGTGGALVPGWNLGTRKDVFFFEVAHHVVIKGLHPRMGGSDPLCGAGE